jgi:hypothetical protein
VADPRPTADPLATLSDHLARLLQHADALLGEWQRYGDQVRGRLDGQVDELAQAVGTALERSGREAAGRLDRQLDQHVGERLAALRAEIDRLREQAAGAALAGGGTSALGRAPRGGGLVLLVLAVSANLMLAALLVVSLRGGADAAAVPDAGPPPAPALPAATCEAALDPDDPGAAAVFLERAAELCGDRADQVRAALTAPAPADAGPADAGPPDAKK